ncbi:porin [Hydrogenophaga sp. OTU3427]|uniref:porin n=1 Tax=Hydrogenophaga sp. OTU3427 TaxID=3043856 RepID=UPI00313D5638
MKTHKLALMAVTSLLSVHAQAQSTVTIDGSVMGTVVKTEGSRPQMVSIGPANQIRFIGSEDLGGGLRAHFVLAERFNLTTGGFDGYVGNRPLFQGESTVGLAGAFGSVRMGRALSATAGLWNGQNDPWLATAYASMMNLTGRVSGADYQVDRNQNDGAGISRTSGIHYVSPNFGGVTMYGTFGLRQTTGSNTDNRKNLTSLWAQYSSGPIAGGVGFEQNRQGDDITAAAGTYDFGVAKIGAGISRIDTTVKLGKAFQAWNVTAMVPVGAVTLKAGIGSARREGAAVGEIGIKDTKFALGASYAFSKRTTADMAWAKNNTSNGPDSLEFSLRHRF